MIAFCFLIPVMHAPALAAESPDPMAMMERMEPGDRWMTMLHGYAFLSFNRQGGPSGGRAFESENHLMLVSMRRWAGGRLSLLGTFTAEPATIPAEGAPLLFQRGEAYNDVLLVDRQHPHDLFVELAARWDRPVSDRGAFHLYLSPWGEPAVGPTAYPHRLSASENPSAPLAHHNQDSTHISANVITAGCTLGRWTLEGSGFHGREPDERRWNIDGGPIDSYSGRLSFRPVEGLSIQISGARRQDPEELEEGNQTRQTASAEYQRGTSGGFIAATLILGRNLVRGGAEWGETLEATWKLREVHYLYARTESVDRDLFELVNKTQRPESVPAEKVRIHAATLGYVRDLPLLKRGEAGLGAGLTFYSFRHDLEETYGDFPVSGQLFIRLRGSSHVGGGAHEHGGP
jgi:hypothetical protein